MKLHSWSKPLTLIFLCLQINNTICGPESTQLPEHLCLDYQVKILPDHLKLHLRISNFHQNHSRHLLFYTGKIQANDFVANDELNGLPIQVHYQNNFISLGPIPLNSNEIAVKYDVTLGNLAKHGHQGFQNNQFCVFAGEQVFMIPATGQAEMISVCLEYQEYWDSLVPLVGAVKSEPGRTRITLTDSSWIGIYNLMKNCYASGAFERIGLNENHKKWLVYFVEGTLDSAASQHLTTGSQQLFHFFENRFQQKLENYRLLFLPFSPSGETIMGGVGPFSMGFSLDPDCFRDWQLLAHRLFHVFYERHVNLKALHFPPYLWLLEGLAGYYEMLASSTLKINPPVVSECEPGVIFAELFRRYLYFRFKDPALFQINPFTEGNLPYEGQTEFLHYTQAPLVIFALEKYVQLQKDNAVTDYVWKWLRQLNANEIINFELRFSEFCGLDLTDFFKKYIHGSNLLELNTMLLPFSETATKIPRLQIIQQLKAYEHLLWTWFQATPEIFLKNSIIEAPFEEVVDYANRHQVAFAASEIEQAVLIFSSTVYGLLKIHFLRLHLCEILPDDDQKNLKLTQPENVARWNSFLDKNFK